MSDTNNYGIPTDPEAALAAIKSGSLKPTEEPDAEDSGMLVELFSISVKDGDKEVYTSGGMFQPFGWTKVSNLAAVLENEGAELDDTTIDLIGSALAGDKNGKAVKALVATYNSVQRANAKQAEYARISNLKKPMSEETKAKKIESMVATFAQISGVSLDAARQALTAAGAFKA